MGNVESKDNEPLCEHEDLSKMVYPHAKSSNNHDVYLCRNYARCGFHRSPLTSRGWWNVVKVVATGVVGLITIESAEDDAKGTVKATAAGLAALGTIVLAELDNETNEQKKQRRRTLESGEEPIS
jgi:hypothetical protein